MNYISNTRIALAIFLLIPITSSTSTLQNIASGTSFLTGKYNYKRDQSFVRVPDRFTQNEVYLKKEAYIAFVKMHKAASRDGINLSIISGARSFSEQKVKWESKWWHKNFSTIKKSEDRTLRLLRWWSMPGTSRHHWGTDVDLNSMNLRYYTTNTGVKVYNWLTKNAASFGFYQPLTPGRSSGYQEEKWHWSYVPLSKVFLKQYQSQVSYGDIKGFKGSETARSLKVFELWVNSVNPSCK